MNILTNKNENLLMNFSPNLRLQLIVRQPSVINYVFKVDLEYFFLLSFKKKKIGKFKMSINDSKIPKNILKVIPYIID